MLDRDELVALRTTIGRTASQVRRVAGVRVLGICPACDQALLARETRTVHGKRYHARCATYSPRD